MQGLFLLQLPAELFKIILDHCPLPAYQALMLTSKVSYIKTFQALPSVSQAKHTLIANRAFWKNLVKTKYRYSKHPLELIEMFMQKPEVVEEAALYLHPSISPFYRELQEISHSGMPATIKQLTFTKKAQLDVTYTRLLLHHTEFWNFLQDLTVRARFIESIIEKWPVAILYVLEKEDLRQQWLNTNVPSEQYCKIRLIIKKGQAEVALLFSQEPTLYKLIDQLQEEVLLCECINMIVEMGSKTVAHLWSIDLQLRAIILRLKNEKLLAECIRTIIAAGGVTLACLWSEKSALRNIVLNIEDEKLRVECIRTILSNGQESVAYLWSTRPELYSMLASITSHNQLFDCLSIIFQKGQAKVVPLWIGNNILRGIIIGKLDQTELASCIKKLCYIDRQYIAQSWLLSELHSFIYAITNEQLFTECMRTIVNNNGPIVVYSWSFDDELRNMIARIQDNKCLVECITLIVREGGKEIARSWSEETSLLAIINQITNCKQFENCISSIVEIGGSEIASLWLNDTKLRSMVDQKTGISSQLVQSLEKISDSKNLVSCVMSMR